ncbi:hypothetical protein LRS12_17900 [Sphingomonas sp. J344]|uniref:hypothetical protein n=1 Tax=Sphingomonas sp. J344 TaxID=2898434 RepID=UPI002150F0E1|nr:hypothetical protein [Sphingomonas sp. J344]MCR5872414.1 hypothetical protein [Sphingomonas sp. J344]
MLTPNAAPATAAAAPAAIAAAATGVLLRCVDDIVERAADRFARVGQGFFCLAEQRLVGCGFGGGFGGRRGGGGLGLGGHFGVSLPQ